MSPCETLLEKLLTILSQFGGSVSEATIDIRMQFVRKVYAILTVQLLATAILSSVSFFSTSYKGWIQANQWAMWTSLFGAIGFMVRRPPNTPARELY